MANVQRIIIELIYAGVDITHDISQYIESFSYTDCLEGESDELQIVVDDTEGKWKDQWYPTKHDKMSFRFGYADLMLDCGTFTVDEIELSGPPSLVTIKGLAAASNSPVRTKRSRNHEGVTLRQIAEKIAQENGLTLVDGSQINRLNIDYTSERNALNAAADTIRSAVATNNLKNYQAKAYPVYSSLKGVADSIILKGFPDDGRYILSSLAVAQDVLFGGSLPDYQTGKGIVIEFANKLNVIANKLNNKTFTKTRSQLDDIIINSIIQLDETDISFLYKLGLDYGVTFSIRDTQLIWMSLYDQMRDAAITTITYAELKSYRIKDSTAGTFKKVKLDYHNPKTNEIITFEGAAEEDEALGYEEMLPNEDTLVLNIKAENYQQAEAKGKSALTRANMRSREGDISIIGNPLMIAGMNFLLQDMGKLSGKYQIPKSNHTGDKSGGYNTNCEIRCIDKPPAGSSGSSSSGRGNVNNAGVEVYGQRANDLNGIYNAREEANNKRSAKALKPLKK